MRILIVCLILIGCKKESANQVDYNCLPDASNNHYEIGGFHIYSSEPFQLTIDYEQVYNNTKQCLGISSAIERPVIFITEKTEELATCLGLPELPQDTEQAGIHLIDSIGMSRIYMKPFYANTYNTVSHEFIHSIRYVTKQTPDTNHTSWIWQCEISS